MSERVDITMNWGVYIFNPHERESRYYRELGSIYIYIYIYITYGVVFVQFHWLNQSRDIQNI